MLIFAVRDGREARGMSLEQLSELTNLTKGYLSKLENGKIKKPGIENIYKISKALDIKIEHLVFPVGNLKTLRKEMYNSINRNGIMHPNTQYISHLIDLIIVENTKSQIVEKGKKR